MVFIYYFIKLFYENRHNSNNDGTFLSGPARKALRSDDAPSPATASVPKTKKRVIATQDDLDDDMLYTPPLAPNGPPTEK